MRDCDHLKKMNGGVVFRDGMSPVDSYEFLPGEEYSEKYENVRELGRGRFGIVYEVRTVTADACYRYAAKHIK